MGRTPKKKSAFRIIISSVGGVVSERFGHGGRTKRGGCKRGVILACRTALGRGTTGSAKQPKFRGSIHLRFSGSPSATIEKDAKCAP